MFPFIYRSWRYADPVRAASAYSSVSPVSSIRTVPTIGVETRKALREMMQNAVPAAPKNDEDHYESQASDSREENPFPRPSLWMRSVFGREGIAARPEKILIGEDGSEASKAALRDAEFLARHYGCEMLRATIPVEAQSVEQGLLETAMRNGCDMIAVGASLRPLSEKLHHGSITEKLMAASLIPVWISQAGPRGSLSNLRKILVPIDDTVHSLKTIAQAVILAHDFEAEFTILHVREKDQSLQAAFERSRPLLDKIPWTLTTVEEEPGSHSIAETIVAYAQAQDIDLILMGTHPEDIHTPLLRPGNAAEVIRYAKAEEARPLLVLHS